MNPTDDRPFAERFPFFMYPATQHELIAISQERRDQARQRRAQREAFEAALRAGELTLQPDEGKR